MPKAARKAYEPWKGLGGDTVRRLTIEVNPALPDDASDEEQRAAQEAATQLLALPWELLHDGDGYLFEGARGVRVNR